MSTALKMLFVNPLDLLLEGATRFIASVTGWSPEQRAVVVGVLDPAPPRQQAKGRIVQVLPNVVTQGPSGTTHHREAFLVVQLSTPLFLNGEQLDRFVAGPRYELHGLTRLILTGLITNIYRVPSTGAPVQDPWILDDRIAIGVLKRTHQQSSR
jgi:hypothetical protein